MLGVGLIGGSVALAARERAGAAVAGYDRSPDALAQAVKRGVLDRACDDVQSAVCDADAVFVAAPVSALDGLVGAALAHAPDDCVVTDVGSTKRAVVAAHDDPRFVGGHPLAGAETAGVANARGDLFVDATWYLTPGADTNGELYERLHRLLHAFGARPTAIEPDVHDRMLATVSHLPHVLANALVGQAASTLGGPLPQTGYERLPQTGPSFRDATRVAGAPSAIWTDIYLSNRDALVAEIDQFVGRLHAVRDALQAGDRDAITAWNDGAADDRRRLLGVDSAGGELFELRVAVPNRPGVIAQLALALGRVGVNISDMALYPTPDRGEGVVALWIAGSEAADRAQQLAGELGHPVVRP